MKNIFGSGASFSRKFNLFQTDYQALRNSDAGRPRLLQHREKIYDFLEQSVRGKAVKALKPDEVERVLDFVCNDMKTEQETLFSQGVGILEMLAEQGIERACNDLADIYSAYSMEPLPIYRRRARAIILYERAAKSDDLAIAGYAHARLAQMYAEHQINTDEFDDRSKKHHDIALGHVQAGAFECASPYAQVVLALWHYDGTIVPKDWRKSFELLELAYGLLQGDAWSGKAIRAKALFHYGVMLYWGHGCTQDFEGGLDLIRRAIDGGSAEAAAWMRERDGGDKDGGGDALPVSDADQEVVHVKINPMQPFAGRAKKKRQENAGRKVRSKKELEKILKPLHDLIGVAPVKREIESLVYLAHANAIRAGKNVDVSAPVTLHAAFLGAPGTGKTTVARLYGRILHELGFLAQGHLVEVTRMDMIGEYVGHTAPKVRMLVEQAKGGVLFVDEAHSLADGSEWDFGGEAISELLYQMENCRENFVVIFAGYTDEMKSFLRVNPGLKSRVANVVEFTDYGAEDMVRIFEKLCRDAKFTVTAEALERLGEYLKKQDKERIRRIGNARGVRNIFEQSLAAQARRVVTEAVRGRKALVTIEARDIALPDDPGKGVLQVVK
ncbi:MAG: AAA family ATPase [Alphaproteobacteria bacterium]